MLKVDIQKRVARVMFDRPETHNAFDDELIARVTHTFTELGSREDIRVIVLGGNGKSKIGEILRGSPDAIAAAKALIFGVAGQPLESTEDFTAEALANARGSSEGQAGMKAFLASEKAPWIAE